MLGTRDKENLLSELTVHREAKKKTPHTVPQSSDQQECRVSGCFGQKGEKEQRKGIRHLRSEVSLKSHLLGRSFARTRGPWGFLAAGMAQQSLEMCGGPGTLAQLKTKLEE